MTCPHCNRPRRHDGPASTIGSVARDNTVKYHWRTLQLLPSPQRPSYAGGARRGAGAPRRRTRGPPPGRDHPLPARPAPLRRAARAPLRAGARPGAGAHRLGARLRRGSARSVGDPSHDERDGRQRRLAAGPGQADAPAHPAPAGALEGHPPGTAAGTLDTRHRPSAGHRPRHRQRLHPRRRPTRAPGCGIIYEQRPAREDIFAEPLSGQSR